MDRIKVKRAIDGLTEWQKHVQTNSDIDRDISTAIEALKAQLSSKDATSDLISRQAAIDALMAAIDDVGILDGADIKVVFDNLPPVQPEPQWIPVEREFPEDYTDVLVWFEYFRYGDYNCLYQTHGIGTYVANYNSWTINHESGWKDLRVIAWMPLPKIYKPNNK